MFFETTQRAAEVSIASSGAARNLNGILTDVFGLTTNPDDMLIEAIYRRIEFLVCYTCVLQLISKINEKIELAKTVEGLPDQAKIKKKPSTVRYFLTIFSFTIYRQFQAKISLLLSQLVVVHLGSVNACPLTNIYSEVFLARKKKTQDLYAIKRINKIQALRKTQVQALL